MATYYGTNAGNALNTNPAKLIEQGEATGRIHILYDEYTMNTTDGALANGSLVDLCGLIPAGARIHNAYVDSATVGGSGTFQIGWLVSADAAEAANVSGLFDTVSAGSSAQAVMLNTATKGAAGAASEGKFKKFTSACQPQLKVTAVFTATSGVIRLAIHYTFD